MKAMILAAGRGERLRPLTDVCPKPLINVAGKTLIEYHLAHLKQLGINDVVINQAWLGHMLEEKLGNGEHYGLSISYSRETSALETAGGIQNALPLLTNFDDENEPFLVVNGDIYIDNLPKVEDLNLSHGKLAKLFMVPNPAHNIDGDFGLNNGLLTLDSANKLTFSGIGVYHPELFKCLPQTKYPLAPLLKDAISKNKVSGQCLNSYWCDVGTIERLNTLEQRLSHL